VLLFIVPLFHLSACFSLLPFCDADGVRCIVQTLDVMKMKPTDTTFTSNFRLNARQTDTMHAFVAYFDIHFTIGDTPVSFSTGPGNPYTHWKQTVFYTDHVITLNRGEVLEGTISCSPGKVNPRFVLHFASSF